MTASGIQDEAIRLLQGGKSRASVRETLGISDEAIKTAMKIRFGHNRVTDIRNDLRMSSLETRGDWDARILLESIRWPGGPVCPRCGHSGRRIGGTPGSRGEFKCSACRRHFTVTTDSALHNNKTPLDIVVYVLRRLSATHRRLSHSEVSRITSIHSKTTMGLVSRVKAAVRSARGRVVLLPYKKRYSQSDFWKDLEVLRRLASAEGDKQQVRFHALCLAIFDCATVERQAVVEPDAGKRFGRYRSEPIRYKGHTKTVKEWAEEVGLEYATLSYRLHKGWSIRDALEVPAGGRPNVRTKLTDGQVGIIKAMLSSGRMKSSIARMYGVAHQSVRSIEGGRTWSRVPTAPPLRIIH